MLLAFWSGCIAQAQTRIWERVGAPPPRISGIVAVRDTVLISTENGAFALSTTSSQWIYQPSVPDGRLLQSTSGAVLAVGALVRFREETSGIWRISSLAEYRALSQNLPRTVPTVTEARVRMAEGHEISVTRGGITVGTGGNARILPSLLDGTQGIIGMVRLGAKVYCALERSVWCIEEVNTTKYNPLEALPFKRFAVAECMQGLGGNVDVVSVQGAGILANRAWFSADSGRSWKLLLRDSVVDVSFPSGLVPTLIARHRNGILYSPDFGQRWFSPVFSLASRWKWYADIRTRQILPYSQISNALSFFIQDTTQRALAPSFLAVSRDGGLQWALTPIAGLPESAAIGNIRESPRGILFASDRGFQRNDIFRSSDAGRTWQILALGRVPDVLAVNPNSGTLFASGSPPMRSANDGVSWSAAEGLPFRTSGRFDGASSFAFGAGGAVLLNVRRLGAFRSDNQGATFSPIVLPARDVYSLRIDSLGRLFALSADTNNGQARTQIWLSGNGGVAWERLEVGLPQHANFQVNDIVVEGARILALTNFGIWRLNFFPARFQAALVQQSDKTALLTSVRHSALSRILLSPNPAQNLVSIAWSEEFFSHDVRIEVLNVLGARVDAGFEKNDGFASRQITFSVLHLPNGQYFCRVQYRLASGEERFITLPFVVQR